MSETEQVVDGIEEVIAEVLRRKKMVDALPPVEERKLLRVNAGLSRSRTAEVVGVTGSAIAGYEDGSRQPKGPHLEAYANLLAALKRVARW